MGRFAEELEDADLKITCRRWLPVRNPMDRLLHAIAYVDDPLNTDISIPPHELDSLFDQCSCSPDAYHEPTCGVNPAYAATFRALGYPGAYPPSGGDWTSWPYQLRWICHSDGDYHTGGEINGPEHWCEREKRVVTQGE